ncbi:MAG: membrane protein insertase YidC, partial [Alphaproteobacteria bacterium]
SLTPCPTHGISTANKGTHAMLKPRDTQSTRNLMVAVVVSLLIMLGFEMLGYGRSLTPQPSPVAAEAALAPEPVVQAPAGMVDEQVVIVPVVLENEKVKVSYNLAGGKVEGWVLKGYTRTGGNELGYAQLAVEADPSSTHPTEYAESGWLGGGIEAPGAGAVWQVVAQTSDTVVLGWKNASGQVFGRELALSDDFTLRVTDSVANTAALPVSVTPYAQVHRAKGELPKEMSTWVSYHGPMGVTVGDEGALLHEESFSSLDDGKGSNPVTAAGGWWGMTSHYFMTAWMPEGLRESVRAFRMADVGGTPVFTASVQGAAVVVPAGGEAKVTYALYAGPKQDAALAAAGHHLDKAIAWGWFEKIAKPFYKIVLWFHGLTGSWALAIVLMTLALKIATFPLANKSYHAMAKMKKLQPQMEAMKERMKDDQQGMAMEMMKLYRDNKVNPLSGCWPMLVQIPIFFAMYKVVLLAFEFRHAAPGLWPLDLWVHDLSLADPLFILPVLMGISMWVQMKLNPPPADPAQAMVFKWMPVIFTVMFLWFPAALVWYWLVNNVLSVAQQYWIMRGDKAI